MPWTSASFKRKHWKTATSAQAKHAAKVANKVLAGGGSEGIAIATGIARAKAKRKSKRRNARYEALKG
jgi:uncharacterized protein YdaT